MSVDLTEFFEHDVDDAIVDSVQQLRGQVREYNAAKVAEAAAAKRKKEAKAKIDKLFSDLPDEYKTVKNEEPRTVAGITFAIVTKTVTIDNSVIIMKQRVDTTFEREAFFKWLNGRISGSEDVQKETFEEVKSYIEAGMAPHTTDVINVEPVKEKKGSRS